MSLESYRSFITSSAIRDHKKIVVVSYFYTCFEHMFVIWKVLMSCHAACFKCFTFGGHSTTVLLAMF